MLKKIAVLGLLLSLVGCGKHYEHVPKEKDVLERKVNALIYEKRVINPSLKSLEVNEDYSLDEIVFRSVSNSYKNKEAVVHYYSGRGQNRPVIIAFTPMGVGEKFMREKSPYFAKRGFDVACIKTKHAFLWHEYDISFSAKLMKEAVDDARVFMDWLGKKEYATFGLSFGGIGAALLAGVDPRIKAGGIAFSGGDIAEMIMNSHNSYVKKYREYRMEKECLNERQYFDQVKRICASVDPLTYAGNINPKNFLIIYSAFDHVIPSQSTRRLYEAAGKPDMIKLYNVHYAFFQRRYAMGKIADKLEKVMK